jgi:uncharacterized protein YjbI with pentapeptide repeats
MNVDLFLSKVADVQSAMLNKITQNGTLIINKRMLDSLYKDACNHTARHCKNAAGNYMFTADSFFATLETNVKALKKNPDTNMRARKAGIAALVTDVVTIDTDITTEILGSSRVIHCYPGMDLKTVIDGITDASADKVYTVICYPGLTISEGLTINQYIKLMTINKAFDGKYIVGAQPDDIDFSYCDISGAIFANEELYGFIGNEAFTLVNTNNDKLGLSDIGLDMAVIVRDRAKAYKLREIGGEANESSWLEYPENRARGAKFIKNKIFSNMFIACDLEASIFECSSINAYFYGCKLGAGNFQNVTMNGSSFVGCVLSNANFSNSCLAFTSFESIEGAGTQFLGAKIMFGGFPEANLTSSSFDCLDSYVVAFNSAILDSASFRYAILKEADFSNASLAGANFVGANLTGAKFSISKAEFKAAVGANGYNPVTTIWTDGQPIGA